MRVVSAILAMLASACLFGPARAADRFFVTADGVRLHYSDSGSASAGPVLVMVPGWTMPAWIFQPQIAEFSKHYRVIALDPRGQGDSDVPSSGYTYDRRGEDIAELLAQLRLQHVVLVGWSLGVLDSLAYVHVHGDQALAGLVLIDNSVGEDPPPSAPKQPPHAGKPQSHAEYMAGFVRSMFHRPQPSSYLQHLTQASLRTPERAAGQLLAYAVPRSYWKEAVYSTRKPVLYIVRTGLSGQAANLAVHHPDAETHVVADLGHAMFVDDPTRFNAMLQSFLTQRVGP